METKQPKKNGRPPGAYDLDKYPIQDGIPLPDRTYPGFLESPPTHLGYPFEIMRVGQSFLVYHTYTPQLLTKAIVSARYHGNKQDPPYRFACRKWLDPADGVEKVRCWRVRSDRKRHSNG